MPDSDPLDILLLCHARCVHSVQAQPFLMEANVGPIVAPTIDASKHRESLQRTAKLAALCVSTLVRATHCTAACCQWRTSLPALLAPC